MSRYKLINDQPAKSLSDSLEFKNLINAIEDHVFNRQDESPLVVGIYGKWGTGKTSLMDMAVEKLGEEKYKKTWIPIKFSPWKYRNEKNLLLPLLATIARKESGFKKVVHEIIKSAPKLIKLLPKDIPAVKIGLPLLTFLSNIQNNKEKLEPLEKKIEKNIKKITHFKSESKHNRYIEKFLPDKYNEKIIIPKRIAFFIDDLDRCHGSGQIIGLLEQILQFLHLERCVFFIGMDKEQIIKEIEKTYTGDGSSYIEKFIQVEFELKPPQSDQLIDMLKTCLGADDTMLFQYMKQIAEVYDFSPRKIKRLWNNAVLSLEAIEKNMTPELYNTHTPNIKLMLKWLLLSECEEISKDPSIYLKYENDNNNFKNENILLELSLKYKYKDETCHYTSVFHQRLAFFLYNDLPPIL